MLKHSMGRIAESYLIYQAVYQECDVLKHITGRIAVISDLPGGIPRADWVMSDCSAAGRLPDPATGQ